MDKLSMERAQRLVKPWPGLEANPDPAGRAEALKQVGEEDDSEPGGEDLDYWSDLEHDTPEDVDMEPSPAENGQDP